MTTTPARDRVRRLDARGVASLADLLERDFDTPAPVPGDRGSRAMPNQYLLDALDRGEHDRFFVWPGSARAPLGVMYASLSGTLVPAGLPEAGAHLADAADRLGWRVLVGDARIGWPLLEASPGGVFRRRARAREQRFMTVEPPVAVDLRAPPAPGFRPARPADLEVLVDFACRLHVEDLMGPPIARSARSGVRARMRETIDRGGTYVVERDGQVVGKADLSLRNPRWGAQIAGVYVSASHRGRGVATELIATLVRLLLREGSPGVSLHVRSDNASAIAAYTRAGLTDRGPWVLALR